MDLIKKTNTFRKIRVNITDPHKVYHDIMYNINQFGRKTLGMDMMNLDFSFVNPRFIFLLIIMTSFLYADLESSVLAEDLAGFAYNIAVLGFGLQGFAKFDAYIFRKKGMNTLIFKGSAILAEHRNTERLKQIMIDSMAFNKMILKFYTFLYVMVFVIMSAFGILISLYSGRMQLSCGFQFSFIDTTRLPGYVATYIYQTTGVFMVAVSSFCNDVLITVLFVNALAMFDCIISDLKELSKLSQLEKTPATRYAMSEQMKSLIKQHQYVLEYLNLSNKVFSLYFFMSLTCLTVAIAIMMIALVWAHWYPGIFMSAVASFQILILCLLGTLLLMKEDELVREVYNVTWYDLDIEEQNSLRLMLLMSQHFKEISYRFGAMNVETYLKKSS
ncbi:putative odorant receptor 83c [Sabethes cyaneus]|uniref:putative odorant receptor 83c n=1 Tax=Sabethes cyaneus TaxID=53552 RepID=UPI00237E827D|nr:putative odorant receptor 83c [Sabethes cyaneus]